MILLTFIMVVQIFFVSWELIYPSQADPKNLRYVFWKAGVWKMDLDTATGAMVEDATRDKLVVGKSVLQLRRRFGFLADPSQMDEYYRRCTQTFGSKDKKILFLGKSPCMVVFEGDSAADLVLCKGY